MVFIAAQNTHDLGSAARGNRRPARVMGRPLSIEFITVPLPARVPPVNNEYHNDQPRERYGR
jgi:hypothetical protein